MVAVIASPHHHLTRSHHHREERHHLTVEFAVHPRKRDEREIGGVEHQFDAHEHDDGVAAHQHTGRADGEQQPDRYR